MSVVIDGHCHAGPGGNFVSGPWDVTANLDRYARRAEQAGIARTVLLPVFHSDYAQANNVVGRLARAQSDRFWWYCMVHAARDRGRILRLVGDAVERGGALGIKV